MTVRDRLGRSAVRSDEGGSIAPAVAVMAIGLFLLAGLVIDSARFLNARSRAIAYAQEAARAGAQQIDLNVEEIKLAPVEDVVDAVESYCSAALAAEPHLVECGLDPDPSVPPDPDAPERVSTRARFEVPAGVLGIVGLNVLSASGYATSIPQQGVTGVDTYPGVPSPTRVRTPVTPPFPSRPRDTDPYVTPTPTTTTTTTTTTGTATTTGGPRPTTSGPPQTTTTRPATTTPPATTTTTPEG